MKADSVWLCCVISHGQSFHSCSWALRTRSRPMFRFRVRTYVPIRTPRGSLQPSRCSEGDLGLCRDGPAKEQRMLLRGHCSDLPRMAAILRLQAGWCSSIFIQSLRCVLVGETANYGPTVASRSSAPASHPSQCIIGGSNSTHHCGSSKAVWFKSAGDVLLTGNH